MRTRETKQAREEGGRGGWGGHRLFADAIVHQKVAWPLLVMEVTGGCGRLFECLDLRRTEAIQPFHPCLYIATHVVAVGQLPAILVADAPVDKERGAELVNQLGPLEVLKHEVALGLCWVDHVLVTECSGVGVRWWDMRCPRHHSK